VDYSTDEPAVDDSAFPNIPAEEVWAYPSHVFYTGYAWAVDFLDGMVGLYDKTNPHYAVCVRNGPIHGDDDDRFATITASPTDVVLDRATGLLWISDPAVDYTWEDSLEHCESFSTGSYSNWRLPNINELRSLVSTATFDPASVLPDTPTGDVWSSTTYVVNNAFAMTLSMGQGSTGTVVKTSDRDAICVHDGP